MTEEDLQAYSDAWNNHDIDAVMSFMTEDCIFDTGGGAEHYGTRYQGFDEVRARFIEVWTDVPDVQFINARHFISGNRGCSEWTFTGTRPDGGRMAIDGCDLFDFVGGKIKVKNSYIKNVA